MSRYPLLAARVLEMEHANKLAVKALWKKTTNKKPRRSKAGGGGDGDGSGSAGPSAAFAQPPIAAAAGPVVGPALPDAGEGSDVGAALPDDMSGDEAADTLGEDMGSDMAVEEAAPTAFVPTIDWATWEARRHHWRVFNEIFLDGQVPLQLRSVIRYEDYV